MSAENPYAAPQAASDILPIFEPTQLAGRFSRLVAQFIDGLVSGLFFLGLAITIIFPIRTEMPALTHIIMEGPNHSLIYSVSLAFLIFCTFLLINISRMQSHGQTIGKRLLGIKVVMENGDPATLFAQIKRYAFMYFMNVIRYIGGLIYLIDILCIFRESRQFLHDNVGKTKVVKA